MAQRPGWAPVSFYLTVGGVADLRELSARTQIPQSRLLREAVNDLLEKYRREGARPGTRWPDRPRASNSAGGLRKARGAQDP